MIKKTKSPFKSLESLGTSYSGNCEKQPPEKWDCVCSEDYAGECRWDDCVCHGDCDCNCDCNCVCDCGYLENGVLTIPNGTVTIRDYTYQGEEDITKVILPEGLTTIGIDAFEGCKNLKEAVLPSTVTKISVGAFANTALEAISIPESVTELGFGAFSGCTNLKTVNISGIKSWCKIKFNGDNSNPLRYGAELKIDGKTVTELIVDETTSLSDGCFANYNYLQKVYVKDFETFWKVDLSPLAYMYPDYYVGGQLLVDVVIPDDVTAIPQRKFRGVKSLRSVKLPSGLKEIGFRAFCESGLESIVVPETVETIDRAAFAGCANLKEIVLPNGCTSVADETFRRCKNLTKVVVDKNVKNIGAYAFYECEKLETVVLPEGLKSIDSGAFAYCKKLKEVNRPASLKTVHSSAFESAPYEFQLKFRN